MAILIKALQLIACLSILVIIHELGHYMAARIFKVRVEKFYLFFNPWFSLVKKKIGETEYGIGWLPLGGYVKISGMIDESMDKEQMKQPPQPWEFRSKPAWQRLIIMLGGVIMNVLLAIVIYIGILAYWGEEYLPTSEIKYGITVDSIGSELGLRNGDKILTINGQPAPEDFTKVSMQIVLDNAQTIGVERDGKPTDIQVPQGAIAKIIKSQTAHFIGFRIPAEIGDFAKKSAAQDAGLQVGDKICRIDSIPVAFMDEVRPEVLKNKGNTIEVVALRGNDSIHASIKVSPDNLLGIQAKEFYTLKEHRYNILQAIPAGFTKTWSSMGNYLKQLKLLFKKDTKAYDSLGGFITIGKIFPSTWVWEAFWNLTAFISIILAIMNVLPIPALDGGHVMFLLYEVVTRRKPGDKFMEYAQVTGMLILFALLIFANGNDIVKLFR